MRQTFNDFQFNENNDMREVDQFGFVDLHMALINGEIPANLESQAAKYNEVTEPFRLRPRPDDIFSGLRSERILANIVRNERAKADNKADKQE